MTPRSKKPRQTALGKLLSNIELPDYLTVRQAAKLMKLSPQRVRQLVLSGALPARKPERDWLIPRDKFLAYASVPHKTGRPPKAGPS